MVLWLKTQLTADCKILRQICERNFAQKFRSEIPHEIPDFAAKFCGGTRRKSISVIMHKNQLTGVSGCFATKKMTDTKAFFLFKFNFNLDVFVSFQVLSIFCFRFNFV